MTVLRSRLSSSGMVTGMSPRMPALPSRARWQAAATARKAAASRLMAVESDRGALAMLALAFLTIAAATEHTSPPPHDQIPLTRNEIAALFGALIIQPVLDARRRLRWSA